MYKGIIEDKDQKTHIANDSKLCVKNHHLNSSGIVINSRRENLNFGTEENTDIFDTKLINAELGLSEDHFSRPEGHFGFSNIEELEMAIENCKEMIMECSEKSERRKKLVMKLVQLRLKLQDCKDTTTESVSDDKLILGHYFEIKQLERPQQYCEKCCRVILSPLCSWFRCRECGFKCHSKCLNSITRICAKAKMIENPTYILDICPEVGLSAQSYRCAECKRTIFFKDGSSVPRKCDYNGLFYCSYCHWNSEIVLPARVIHNWDFEPRKVCRASLQFLRLMARKPILKVESLNPMLFPFVKELCLVKKLREEILMMKQYFMTCHTAQESRLLLTLHERQHFVEGVDMYSLQDLIDIESGKLLDYLESIRTIFTHHITKDCQGCRGKGFICELCKSNEVLFPFENESSACARCSALFHKECYYKRGHCPRCIRRSKVLHEKTPT